MKEEVNWIEILRILAEGDAFGHESWFEVGVEQHKEYYYCLLGDCSASQEAIQKAREGIEPEGEEYLFLGKSELYFAFAIQEALLKWLERSLRKVK